MIFILIMAAMDRPDDVQNQVDCLEKWLWKTYNWVKGRFWGDVLADQKLLSVSSQSVPFATEASGRLYLHD